MNAGASSSAQSAQSADSLQLELPTAKHFETSESGRRMAEDVGDFEMLLERVGRATARELQALRPAWTDRYIRQLAQHSERVLSFPGSRGYTLIARASLEELQHAENALGSQIAIMEAKRIRLHNIVGLRHASARIGDREGGR